MGSGVCRRSGEILERLRNMADPRRPVGELFPGHRQHPIADLTRLLQATGWHATIPLEVIIADTLAWWRAKARENQAEENQT